MINKQDLIPHAYLVPNHQIIIQCVSPHNEKWRVYDGCYALSNEYAWDYMPIPSDRTPEWIDAHTFDSIDDALDAINEVTNNA